MQKSLLALLGVTSSVMAAQSQHCAPEPPATCYPDDCKSCYCLGPDNRIANAPARPVTCNGDWMITVAGFYWEAHQDGMDYAISNHVAPPSSATIEPLDIRELSNLVDAEYENPNFKWDFGFKVGLGYNTTCDGWDIGITWTWYRGKAHDKVEAEASDNYTLLPLWSAYNSSVGGTLFASDIESDWKLELNLIDIELGREYWVSKMMTVRPFMGLRIGYIDQSYNLKHKGGAYGEITSTSNLQSPINNEVDLKNDFHGVGVRGGLDSILHLGCGWGIYGNLAASVVYGRFSVDHDETNRLAQSPHTKSKVLEVKENFRASRAMLDLGLGLQWAGLFCDCKYGLSVSLGWEQHLFFHQNQMWRVNRIGEGNVPELPNDNGENAYIQSRGTLDTQGVTLKVVFEF